MKTSTAAAACAAMFLPLAMAALARPAVAGSLYDQYAAASTQWFDTFGDTGAYLVQYPQKLAEGLDGTWSQLDLLGLTEDNPDLIAKNCSRQPISIDASDPMVIKTVRAVGTTRPQTTTYTSMGGDMYGVATNKDEAVNRLGIDPKTRPDIALNLMRSLNGIATLQRPSPDILIVQTNYSIPMVLGRCPKG